MLAIEVLGSGPDVLLLHAGVADRRMWRSQLLTLSEELRLWAVDLPGFGDSPEVPGHYVVADLLADQLRQLHLSQVRVVGASYGGRVALELAAAYPDMVERMVLLCPAAAEMPTSTAVQAFAAEEAKLLAAGDLVGATELNVATWLGPEAGEEARQLLRTMQGRVFEVGLLADDWPDPPDPQIVVPDLTAIDCPTTVVTGGHDLDAFQWVGRHLEVTLPRAQLVELPWAGHLPTLERPDEMSALLRGWLT